jgi:hypothetical protein
LEIIFLSLSLSGSYSTAIIMLGWWIPDADITPSFAVRHIFCVLSLFYSLVFLR